MESYPGHIPPNPEADNAPSAELPFVPGLVARVIDEDDKDSRVLPTNNMPEKQVLSPREAESLAGVRTLADLVEQSRQSDRESLTGLLNKRGFDKSLQHSIESLPGNFSLVLIDVDNFKTINDMQGHEAGDKALKEIAVSLVSSTREYDALSLYPRDQAMPGHVARQGGDEFAVILPGVHDEITMQRVIDRMVADVKENANVGISAAGVVHTEGQDAQTLRELADTAQRIVKDERKIGGLTPEELKKYTDASALLEELFPGKSARDIASIIDALRTQQYHTDK